MKNKDCLAKEKSFAESQKKSAKVKWPCMCPKCLEKAINSHLLQRRGILSYVTKDNHLYEVVREDAFKWHKTYPLRFKKVGLNNAISYPLFCAKHDTDLFLPIENGDINFDDYISQLLFSYRAVCAEIRKKEFISFETKENIANIEEISFIGEGLLASEDRGIKDLMYYKYLIEDEIKNKKGKFTFYHYTYPFLGIYASAAMSYEIFDSKSNNQLDAAISKKVWDCLFIHIIPQTESSHIIIGYHDNHTSRDMEMYVKSWKGLSKEELGYKLTDLFVAHIEDWGLSPKLYDMIPEERFDKFFALQKNYSTYILEQKTNVDYNFFDGLL